MAESYGKKAVIRILMQRDGLREQDAEEILRDCRFEVENGADPEEVLADDLGLEPDYIWALL